MIREPVRTNESDIRSTLRLCRAAIVNPGASRAVDVFAGGLIHTACGRSAGCGRPFTKGHTDNVGNDAYNQKLSEDRAHSVVVWLTAHGIAAGRLMSNGYGKTIPVADNSTDQGRAKNRRVEIADPGCTAKTPTKAGN